MSKRTMSEITNDLNEQDAIIKEAKKRKPELSNEQPITHNSEIESVFARWKNKLHPIYNDDHIRNRCDYKYSFQFVCDNDCPTSSFQIYQGCGFPNSYESYLKLNRHCNFELVHSNSVENFLPDSIDDRKTIAKYQINMKFYLNTNEGRHKKYKTTYNYPYVRCVKGMTQTKFDQWRIKRGDHFPRTTIEYFEMLFREQFDKEKNLWVIFPDMISQMATIELETKARCEQFIKNLPIDLQNPKNQTKLHQNA